MNDAEVNNKFFRAEKTGKPNDDRKVLLAGGLMAIIILLAYPLVDEMFDKYLAPRPFVEALVKVKRVQGKAEPFILYDADATQNVKGTWIASVYTVDPNGTKTRVGSRRGDGAYTDREDKPKLWSWEAFFDNEQGYAAPNIPTEPFQVCVRYDVYTSDSNTHDRSPNFCSETFIP